MKFSLAPLVLMNFILNSFTEKIIDHTPMVEINVQPLLLALCYLVLPVFSANLGGGPPNSAKMFGKMIFVKGRGEGNTC